MQTEQLDTVKDSAINNADKAGNNKVVVSKLDERKEQAVVSRNGVDFVVNLTTNKEDKDGLTKASIAIDINDGNVNDFVSWVGKSAPAMLSRAFTKWAWDKRNNPKFRELGNEGFWELLEEDDIDTLTRRSSGKVKTNKTIKIKTDTIMKCIPNITEADARAMAIKQYEEEKAAKKAEKEAKK